MDVLLEIESLHVARGQRKVLTGLDLTIYRGEILGVIGRNGAGKSTLVNVICGRVQPQSGSVRLDGEHFAPESPEAALTAGVSVIEQDFQPPVDMTVTRAIFRGTFMADWAEADLLEHAHRVADRAHVTLPFDALVGELDPAQQAMVEVLRVVAEEAQLVILDEASVVLDDVEIAQLHYAARKLRDLGCSIIYIAHRIDEVHAIADRVVVLRGGVASEIVEPRRTPVDDLVFAMLQHPVERPARREPRAPTSPAITVTNLVADNVDGVDLSVEAGEIVAVIGRRGSGATEAMHTLGGLRPGSVSEIVIAGQRYENLADAVGQVAALGVQPAVPTSSIADELGKSSEAETEIGRLRDAATLAHHLEIATSDIGGSVMTLSGGDRQKVTIASAGRVEQPVVVLTQPTRGVDMGAKQRVHGLVDRFCENGKAILVSSNDLSELLTLAHRVVVFFQGRMVVDMPTAEANADLLMAYAETGESGEPVYVRASRDRGSRERGPVPA